MKTELRINAMQRRGDGGGGRVLCCGWFWFALTAMTNLLPMVGILSYKQELSA